MPYVNSQRAPSSKISPKTLPWTPRPSQSSHGRDDDSGSLNSIPSLTGSGSTMDSGSVWNERHARYNTPTSHMPSLETRVPNCVHSFKSIETRSPEQCLTCQACRRPKFFTRMYECSSCAIHHCHGCYITFVQRITKSISSNSKSLDSQRMSWKGDMCDIETTDNLSQRPEPNGPLKSLQTRADSMRGVVAGYAKILTQPPVPITMQINEPLALDNEYSKEFLSVGRTDKENVVVETHNSFPVNVLMAWHDRAQLIDASECDGDVCYVSRKLMESYNINPEVGQACITWRKLDGDAFTHTWCEVLETSQIIGSANLILGRDRQKREWNDCETMEDVIELTRTRLPSGLLGQFDEDQHTVISEVYDIRALSKKISEDPSSESGHGDTKFSLSIATAHREIEDASEGVSDGDCSWLSSSNESSDTALDLAQERRDQIIGRIVLAVTQWLQSQFIYAHKTTNEATTGTFGCQNMPSGTLGQLSQDQAKAEGKRKLSERRGDGGEDDDDDSMRLTDVGTTDKGKTKEILRFACPYFKYNPNKYKEWPNCPGPGWPDVHRVKEHLYRRHRQPKFRCVRCWVCFEVEQNYTDHQRAPIPCELGEKEPVEGFDTDQERQLRSRKKRNHTMSEVEKWRGVFHILFQHVPEDNIPSAFYDYEQLSSPTTRTHGTLSECEQYVLREIPLRLREILVAEFDRDFQIIAHSLKQRAIESTSAIVASLFQEFRNLHLQDNVPTTSSGPSTLQGHAGPSLTQAQPSWFDSLESSRIFPDLTEIDFDFAFAADGNLPPFEDVQLEDIPRPLSENCALRQSDSGYESNNPERPNEKVAN